MKINPLSCSIFLVLYKAFFKYLNNLYYKKNKIKTIENYHLRAHMQKKLRDL